MKQDPLATTPSRRAVVRTAAWSVPAVMAVTAAPAYAVTGAPLTETHRVHIGLIESGGEEFYHDFMVPGTDLHAYFSGWVWNEGLSNQDPSMFRPLAAPHTNGLALEKRVIEPGTMEGEAVGMYAAFHPEFFVTNSEGNSVEIRNIRFTIAGIDALPNGVVDHVRLSPGFVVESRGSNIVADSTGEFDAPFRPIDTSVVSDVNDPAGRVTIFYPGAISYFELDLFASSPAGVPANTAHSVWLTDVSFDATIYL